MKTIIVMLLATLIASFSFGQAKLVSTHAKAEQAILAIEDEYIALNQDGDFTGLAALLERIGTDNFTGVSGHGDVADKATAINQMRTLAEKKDPALRYQTFKQSDRRVEVYGDAAVFSAQATWRTQADAKAGKAPSEALFTHFFVKQAGVWKLAKAHVTDLLPKQPTGTGGR